MGDSALDRPASFDLKGSTGDGEGGVMAVTPNKEMRKKLR